MIGWNGRMDGFQGAVLSVKLKHLPAWNDARKRNARLYDELLLDVDDIVTPVEVDGARHVYHIYAIRTNNRDALISYLAEKNVYCGIHYPVPIHLQNAYRFLEKGQGSFPTAERHAGQLVSMPMFPELSEDQIQHAVRETKQFITSRGNGIPT